ncbi:OLC1v1001794C1, partial [Oldenlandia corymbosa var. corymbosa]
GEIAEFRFTPPPDYEESTRAILNGIFWTCGPRVITTECRYTESLYKSLVLGDELYYFRSPKGTVWRSRLEGIEILDSKQSGRRGMKLDKVLDWNDISNALEAQNDSNSSITVGFNLEWETCASALP